MSMPEVDFLVEKAEAIPFAAAPGLIFKLRINQAAAEKPPPIHTIALRCQIRIEPARRSYNSEEKEYLLDLFGTPERWGQTVRSLLWTHTSLIVPSFRGSTLVDLPVPCTYDFNVGSTRYFYALKGGEVPLLLLFSGTIFFQDEEDALQVAPISWEKEAAYRLPVKVWEEMMELYYPNRAWLCLRKDVFDRLYQYKMRHSLPTWEQALERLLSEKPSEQR